MRPLLRATLAPLLLAAAFLPAAVQADVRIVTEDDGTVRVTNRGSSGASRASVVLEEGVMTVRLGIGPTVIPRADLGQHDAAFQTAAARHELSVDLLKAVARVESAFDPGAVSTAGAKGLMQLMPETGRAMGVTDFFDPTQSILGGARYLRKMLDRFDDLELALAAYNAGPKAVEHYDGIPPFEETRRYVQRVLGLLDLWSEAKVQPES